MTFEPPIARAYREAIYRVDAPGRSYDLAIGGTSAELDRLLAAAGAARWAYVTAANPASIPLDDEQNARRTARLDAEIARRGWPVLPGVSLDPAGAWPPEPSRLLLGVDEDEARALARRFGQSAFVAGERGGPARLVWVDGGGAPAST